MCGEQKGGHTADEQGVPGEDGAVAGGAVFKVVAYAVLGVAGSVEGADGDAGAEGEGGVVGWGGGDVLAILAGDDGERVVFKLALSAGGLVWIVVEGLTISVLPPAWSWWLCLVSRGL